MKGESSELPNIYRVSKLPTSFGFQDFNARLLYYLTPQRLETTIKSIPRNGQLDKVGKILDKAFKRYTYLQQKQNGVVFPEGYEVPPKVQILITGGSVTQGTQCNENPVAPLYITPEECSWPRRLYDLLEHFFPDIVDGHIIAIGGKNTKVATELFRYDMMTKNFGFPEEPDVVINSHSTNDSNVNLMRDSNAPVMTHGELLHESLETFIRLVLKPRSSCEEKEPPLLLFFNDYLGNHDKDIRRLWILNSVANQLSTYYGLGFISYADAVRDFVYGDTNERWFSAKEWPKHGVHPGMGGHISMMYVVAYNLLNMVTTYCDRLEIGPENMYNSSVPGMPRLQTNKTLVGEPKPKITSVLPPEMTVELLLDDISEKWRAAEDASIALGFNPLECTENDKSTFSPCTFKWFFGLLQQPILDLMKPYLVSNNGWKQSEEYKTGLVPTTSNAAFSMKFNKLKDQVQVMNFVVMQSYGDKWAGSKIEVRASVFKDGDGQQAAVEQSLEIEGFHDSQTSESFNFALDLGEDRAVEGDSLVIDVKLVGGSTFKIMGMMFCRF